MIPKDGKRSKADESKQMVTGDDDSLLDLQEEVRSLHFQLKQKDSIIDRLR